MLAWNLKVQKVGEQGRLPEAGGLGSMSKTLTPTTLNLSICQSALNLAQASTWLSFSQCTVYTAISTRYTLIALCVSAGPIYRLQML